MKSFSDLDFHPHPMGAGVQATIFYPNGYGASVVRHNFSYGGPSGLYELAVLKGDARKWELTYQTSITKDVLGWLSEAGVSETLNRISRLRKRVVA